MGATRYLMALDQLNAMVFAPERVPITDFEAWSAAEDARPLVTCCRCGEVDGVFDEVTGLPPGFVQREDGPICDTCANGFTCPTCGQRIPPGNAKGGQ